MEEIILASGSPRRKEILTGMGISFTVVPSRYEEDNGRKISPEKLVRLQAEGKAKEVFARTDGTSPVLGADTIVSLDGAVLGKPRDAADAERMLRLLSGRTHHVITGTAVISRGEIRSRADVTEISFRNISEEEIRAYIASGEPMDKAGAYAVQGGARAFVTEIRGSFSNVVGLPKSAVRELLAWAEGEKHENQ